jgi:Na+-transporting NADH:ubiquinone oxidoreductase subunit D
MANKILVNPLIENNPILTQVLGICSALAVTTQIKVGFTMAVALTLVVTFSNLIISLLRNVIPGKIRMIVELCIIASLVIITDQTLKAFLFETSKQLSVFVGLIITNCIVMGRAEAFALGNKPGASVLDGLGNGLGYGIILLIISTLRELLGSGKLLGIEVIPQALYDMGYVNMGLMVLAPGAFFLIGIIAWLQKEYLIRKGVA